MNEKSFRDAAEKYQELILQPYDEMMAMDGFEAICAFSKTFSGTSVYVPSLRTIFGQCLEMDILTQHNGTNVRDMVKKYGYSERYVRDLLKRERHI